MFRFWRNPGWSGLMMALILVTLSGVRAAPPTDSVKEWERFDFRNKRITAEQLKDLNVTQLKYLRGIVFGKHGRVFQEETIQKWLKTRPWYRPAPKYKVTVLNDNERANMDAIKEAEWRKHETIEPGDLKFYRDREIKREELGEHSNIEWLIMRSEIEAIHGKRFTDQPWLQRFFEERYWYRPRMNYDPGQLNAFERKNIATIAEAQKKQRKLALAPGDMELFQETPITPELLRGLGLYELRLLRNEVYARHGKRFRTAWIQDHFLNEEWYKPLSDYREPELSTVEQKNVATILAEERRIHDELTTKPIAIGVLKNLFLEDARKLRYEILARHGKIFKDRWLNDYFRSFSWYKPDPDFNPAALNVVEKKNVTTILTYEKKAESEANRTAA
jgi:hypothetical protein